MYFSIPIFFKLNLVISCFFIFPGCHAFQTRPQFILFVKSLVVGYVRNVENYVINSVKKSDQKLENGRKSIFPCSRIYLNSSLVP